MTFQLTAKNTDETWLESVEAYVEMVYRTLKTSIHYSIDETLAAMHQHVSLTYGEILCRGFQALTKQVPSPLHENDVFVDCGSGLGKLLLQAALLTPARQIIGIEIEPHFAAISRGAIARLQMDCAPILDGKSVSLIQGSFFDNQITNATVMFSCSLCFSEAMTYALGCWMSKHPNLRAVWSLKPLSSLLGQFHFVCTVEVECTWDTAIVYIYERRK